MTCKVVRVYDGDTVWVAVNLPGGGGVTKICCRLSGIDTPEMPSSHAEAMTEYHRRAFAARDRLVELVTDRREALRKRKDDADAGGFTDSSGTPLPSLSDHDMQKDVVDLNRAILTDGVVLSGEKDKYGRCLASLRTTDFRDVVEVLLDEGHGTDSR